MLLRPPLDVPDSISRLRRIGSAGVIVVVMRHRFAIAQLLADLLAAVFVAVLLELDVWRRSGVLGTHIAGPRWLTMPLPLLIAFPLLWRRRFPLFCWTVILIGVVAQAVASGDSAEGLELLLPLALGSYAVAAFRQTAARAARSRRVRCGLRALRG
jgi:hypothetical protein